MIRRRGDHLEEGYSIPFRAALCKCLTDRQGAWVQWDLIEDVSPSRESVLSLAARCNALGLSPLHFRDVVLDSINT